MLLFLLCTSVAIANETEVRQSSGKHITGVVADENGDPVTGANVIVTGTTTGTVTDLDGKFNLKVPDEKSSIRISYLGYKDQIIPIADKTSVNITLVPDSKLLDEVVAIGYGTVKRRDLTGAVASVNSKDLTMAPVANSVEAMQGRIAGLDIHRSSGKADSDSKILLRGNRTLLNASNSPSSNNEPIYIIDGIQGSINNLNPNDIASIDVLKDASSTAIYGSQGANGVIIVTTKQAQKGKIQMDFDAYVGVNMNPLYPKALQGNAWLNHLRDGYSATNPTAESPSTEDLLTAYSYQPDKLMPYINNGQWIDWVDETLQTGVQQNYTFSARGGNETVKGNFSLGYNSNKGVYENDNVKRYTMRAGTELQLTKWMKAGIQTGLIWKDNNSIGSRINKTFGIVPLGQVYDENGNINVHPIEGMSDVSPIADYVPGTYQNNQKSFNVTANTYVEFNILKGLTYKSIFGADLSAGRRGIYNSDHTYMALSGSSTPIRNGTYETSLNYNYTWENIVTYNTTIAKHHDLTTTFITSWRESQAEESSAYNEGFLYDEFLYYNLKAGNNPSVSSKYTGSSMMSYAGRLHYSYKGKYLATFSIRADGASQLEKKWDTFPAGAFAWRISDETFMDNTKEWLSNLKLRTGYGISGNYSIKPYSSKTEVTSGSDALNLGGGKLITNIPTEAVGNINLAWEKSYNLNLGLDFGFLNNRIEGTIEWYNTDTKDVLYERSLPYSSGGFTTKTPYKMTGNFARIENTGIELTLFTRNIETKNFRWNSTVTFAKNTEKVKEINLGSGTTVDNLKSLNLFVGHPAEVIYGIKKLGVWQLGEEADAAVFGLAPGDTKVQTHLTKVSDGVWVDYTKETPVEYNATNQYTVSSKTGSDDDRVIIGQRNPKWTAGFNNSFYFRGFDLNVLMTARWGQWIDSKILGYFDYGTKYTAMPDIYNCWTPENPTNDFPRYYLQRTTSKTDPKQLESLRYVDASFVKIKNITLGYSLPKDLFQKAGLSNLRVYATIYNPVIMTKSHLLKGSDPEIGGDNDSFPLYRQMVFGVNVSF